MSATMLQTAASYFGRVLPHWRRDLDDAADAGHQSLAGHAGPDGLSAILPGLSLSARFAFAAALVLCNCMALLGGWVVTQIERGLSQNAAASESVYLQNLLSPIVPLLLKAKKDTPQITGAIDNVLQSTHIWNPLPSIAIWLPDGVIAYSTDKNLVGHKFTFPTEVRNAFNNEVRTTVLDKKLRVLDPLKRDGGTLRTVYTPLRENDRSAVMAVVEVVTNAEALTAQLDSIRKRTWIVVGIATLLMIGVLFGIVQRGSRTIEEQRLEIQRRLDEEIRLGLVNKELSERLQEANRRGIELGEEQLRRISSDLENGPAQLLALALLRMYELKPGVDQDENDSSYSSANVVDVITQATAGAQRELREITSGLTLPELQRLSPYEAVERAIRAHEQTTGTLVERNISSFPQHLPLPFTICIFRLVQEGLMNAYCHAGALGQTVTGSYEEDSFIITVSDAGFGFSPEEALQPGTNLGLRWLRQRVESIGGTLTIRSAEDSGTQLSARFPYAMLPSQVKETAEAFLDKRA